MLMKLSLMALLRRKASEKAILFQLFHLILCSTAIMLLLFVQRWWDSSSDLRSSYLFVFQDIMGESYSKELQCIFSLYFKNLLCLNLERFLCMSCLGLLVHAVRRTLPVLPYVCPHTSLVPLSCWLWGAGQCTRTDPWDIAGPSLPHPKSM